MICTLCKNKNLFTLAKLSRFVYRSTVADNNRHSQMTSIEKLVNAIKRQQDAGTGIVLVRTMEPKPVAAALMQSKKLAPDGNVAGWNIVQGWQWTENNVPRKDADVNPFSAMMKIADKSGDGKNPMKSSVFFVEGLHPFLGAQPNPQITQLLRQYAVELPLSEQRMILVMPDSYVLPDELQHDIPTTTLKRKCLGQTVF